MLKIPLILFFIRVIPESILLILFNYIISNEKIDKKRILFSGILLGISSYIIRLLPIHFGVHTMIILMTCIFLTSKVNQINIISSIQASIISFIVLFTCDWIFALFYTNILNISFYDLFKHPIKSVAYSIPSLVLMFSIMMIIFYIKKYRNKKVG
ncbi:hypothetical protein IZY60_10900 [Lutibacter sp. B2]|nr:hypothetical protein [Lutibacter sp. B2]